jgi:hypothetical protein
MFLEIFANKKILLKELLINDEKNGFTFEENVYCIDVCGHSKIIFATIREISRQDFFPHLLNICRTSKHRLYFTEKFKQISTLNGK